MISRSKKSGWIYDYTKILDMEYAWRKTGASIEIMTIDKVKYSVNEMRVLAATIGGITPEIHLVKRIFKGEIVESVGK